MWWAPTFAWLLLGRIIAGAAASTYSTCNAFIADISEPDKRAQNFGLMGAAFGAGFVVGPVIGGFLGEYGARVPFLAAATLAFANLLYGALVLPETLAIEKRRAFDWSPKEVVYSLGAVGILMVLVQAFLLRLVLPKIGPRRAAILNPPFMTQLFAFFTAATAPLYFPGAPYIAAAFLSALALVVFIRATENRAPTS